MKKKTTNLQSWTKVLGRFCVSGAFSNSHRSKPSPHPTNKVGLVYPEFFSEFQLCIGWGREKCKKISKMTHCLKREPKNDIKICILQYCPKDSLLTLLLFLLYKTPVAMWFPAKITSSCIWVTIPVDWVILHWYTCGADERSLGRAVYGHVITKFSGMGSLLYFLTHGDPLARFARERSAVKVLEWVLLVRTVQLCKSV